MRFRNLLALGSIAGLVAACSDASAPTQAVTPNSGDLSVSESMGFDAALTGRVKVHPTVQAAAARQHIFAGPPMIYHAGGRVNFGVNVANIYWSNNTIYSGGPTPGSHGAGSADGSLVGFFLSHEGGTPFWSINNEYTDNVGGTHHVSLTLNYTNYYANNVGAPTSGQNVSDAAIRNMLASVVGSANMPFDQKTIYNVFSDVGVNLGGGFGTTYCAYHGFFARPGHAKQFIIYSVMPLDGSLPGTCTAVNAVGHSPNGDFNADAEVNVLSHEVEEAATDPGLNAWFDGLGQENADKCAWTFTPTFASANGSQANVTFGGKDFLIQRNWRLGPNLSNQIGCTLS
jgi:hypothetical protein